jgi:hypothetical protein
MRHPLRGASRAGVVLALSLALTIAACGGHPAPSGYSCDFRDATGTINSYCATYATFNSTTDFNIAPGTSLNGAYSVMSLINLQCQNTCGNLSHAGFIGNYLALINGSNFVMAGIWNFGGAGNNLTTTIPGQSGPVAAAQTFEEATTNGFPHFQIGQVAVPKGPINAGIYGTAYLGEVGVEMRRYFVDATHYGYLARFIPYLVLGGTLSPGITLSGTDQLAPDPRSTLMIPAVGMTNVSLGEMLSGTNGATAETSSVSPPELTDTILSTATFPAPSATTFPSTDYRYTLQHGEAVQVYRHTTPNPPYGTWLYVDAHHHLVIAPGAPTSATNDFLLLECCTANSFTN